jgi:hypothetical protein
LVVPSSNAPNAEGELLRAAAQPEQPPRQALPTSDRQALRMRFIDVFEQFALLHE